MNVSLVVMLLFNKRKWDYHPSTSCLSSVLLILFLVFKCLISCSPLWQPRAPCFCGSMSHLTICQAQPTDKCLSLWELKHQMIVQSVESRDRQMQLAEVHIHLDAVTNMKNRRWHFCVVFLTFLHILYVDPYCLLLYMIIFVSTFTMLFSLIASSVTSCSPFFPHFSSSHSDLSTSFPPLPLKSSPLLLFPHFPFSPSPF